MDPRNLRKLDAIATYEARNYARQHGKLPVSQQTSFMNNLGLITQSLVDAHPGKRARFADTGSGMGLPAIIATTLYDDAIGIEADASLNAAARRVAQKARDNDVIQRKPRLVYGDFLEQSSYKDAQTRFEDIDVFYNFTVREPCEAFLEKFASDAKSGARAIVVLTPESFDDYMHSGNAVAPHSSNRPWYHIIEKKT